MAPSAGAGVAVGCCSMLLLASSTAPARDACCACCCNCTRRAAAAGRIRTPGSMPHSRVRRPSMVWQGAGGQADRPLLKWRRGPKWLRRWRHAASWHAGGPPTARARSQPSAACGGWGPPDQTHWSGPPLQAGRGGREGSTKVGCGAGVGHGRVWGVALTRTAKLQDRDLRCTL